MEKTFLILMLLLPVNMNAQMQRFIEPGKTWHVRGQVLYRPSVVTDEYYCFTEESDTLIDNVHYMRLFEVNEDKLETVTIYREEEGIVYRYYPEIQKEHLYYDFTLSPQEIINIHFNSVDDVFASEATSTDILRLGDGTQARRTQLVTRSATDGDENTWIGSASWNDVWIEGIGNIVSPRVNILGNSWTGMYFTVMSVTRGGEVLYSHTPAGIADISTAKDADGPAYDIQGRPVPQDTKHGFIIRNGRKMWRK